MDRSSHGRYPPTPRRDLTGSPPPRRGHAELISVAIRRQMTVVGRDDGVMNAAPPPLFRPGYGWKRSPAGSASFGGL